MFNNYFRRHALNAGVPMGSIQYNHADVNIRRPIQVECNWWVGRGRYGTAVGITLLLKGQNVNPENRIALQNLQEEYRHRFPEDLMELNAQRTNSRVKTVIYREVPFNPLVENPENQYAEPTTWILERLQFLLNHL